ncbi:putative cytochrome P450 superfamily [Helianthus annuus]|uniref:Cytochrome P450 superfamily n=1 Tax=Helianthus annuus TaxID=4232 RepID=A0A251UD26_HELAN|nr:putative cytochrome P450 superfamily [Helianthus annuus]KAJ0550774.1 putative cytochrome P450 superfamily [Helianthus annuus]KAJ0563742.1 putative cytochrome P450 superfamily [Helianthus annuus]KAJ0729073.1 putative cytochrome P450 superfamily [Helianthus annuus]KAJ0731823.1 putative cytochrome P450 superfamily [Helianthus annuus]
MRLSSIQKGLRSLRLILRWSRLGGGGRSCPAMNTAPATVEFVLANLLYWFDWEVPDGVKNEDLNMQEEGTLVLRKKVPLCLVPTNYIWDD